MAGLFVSSTTFAQATGSDFPNVIGAHWTLEKESWEPAWDENEDNCHGNEAYVFCNIGGDDILSEGRAADAQDFCSVSASLSGMEGTYTREYKHTSPSGKKCMDYAAAEVSSEITTTIDLVDPWCKSKTEAYVETTSTVTPNAKSEVDLDRESGQKKVGKVSIPLFFGIKIAFEITTDTGSGPKTEDDDNDAEGEGATNRFVGKVKCKLTENSVAANGGMLGYDTASCTSSIEGSGEFSQQLSCISWEEEEEEEH